jgi:hypothetical protein
MTHLHAILRKFPGRLSKVDAWAWILMAGSLALSLGWILYTGYVEEDAFITFRFARQIAAGNGFVYNTGERIYGTTTPLLTLLLSGWLKFISTDVVAGARVMDVFASLGTLFFTWQTLRTLQRSTAEQFFSLAALVFSSNLLYMSAQGMEVPLATCLMAASWYACATGRAKWTGFLCGLLLWTRIDLLFWPVILGIVSGVHSPKHGTRIALFTGLTYLPWLIFAAFYFGSPIPHTITAKWVAYSQFNQSPLLPHLVTILDYLSPFYRIGKNLFPGSLLVLLVIVWSIWRGRIVREKMFLALLAFVVSEVARLTLTRETFSSRYFIPLLWATMVLFGIGLGMLWNRLENTRIPKNGFKVFLSLTLLAIIGSGLSFARSARAKQTYRYDQSLEAIGLWLYRNSDPRSTVLLEPLGYVGYYSERRMVDEVGLVTPQVVNLKLQQVESGRYASIFRPDYVILHCDDALRMQSEPETGLGEGYNLAREFNPLAFDPSTPGQPPDPDGLIRNSCYQIWRRKTLSLSTGKP